MPDLLFNLDFQYWDAALLAFIPALINAGIFLYSIFRLPRSHTQITFAQFVICVFFWQVNDVMMRMSATLETATLWYRIFSFGIIFSTPAGVHFALMFSNHRRWKKSIRLLSLLYFPAIFFSVLSTAGIIPAGFVAKGFWRWTFIFPSDFWGMTMVAWMTGLMLLMFFILLRNAYGQRNSVPSQKAQAFLIAGSMAVPVIQALLTEVFIPIISGREALPLASTFMIFFSASSIIALKKYQLFEFSPKNAWDDVVDTMNEGVVIACHNNIIRYANRFIYQKTGFKEYELSGRKIQSLFFEEEIKKWCSGASALNTTETKKTVNNDTDTIGNGVKNGNGTQKDGGHHDWRIKTLNGKYMVCNVSCSPYYSKTGKEIGRVFIFSDITQRKITEEKLTEKVKDLNMFVYRASHDLRGPVASVMGLCNIALSEISEIKDKAAILYFDKINTSINRLDDIIKDLTCIVRITQGKLEFAEIDFRLEINKLLESIAHIEKFKSTDITVNVSPVSFSTDRTLLVLIFQNLIINAIKYSDKFKPESTVTINVSAVQGGVRLVVEDNGVGMSPEIQPRIFDMFFRGNESSKGSGLGLFIVKNAIEKLNGKISVSSEPGKGSAFTVFLPAP